MEMALKVAKRITLSPFISTKAKNSVCDAERKGVDVAESETVGDGDALPPTERVLADVPVGVPVVKLEKLQLEVGSSAAAVGSRS